MILGNLNMNMRNTGRLLGFVAPRAELCPTLFADFYLGEHVVSDTPLSAMPHGYRPPVAYALPPKDGAIATKNELNGAGAAAANLAGGLYGNASIAGTGTVSSAAATLLIYASSTVSGSGAVSADISATLDLAATLAASGDVTGALNAVLSAIATLSGSGSASGDMAGVLSAAATLAGTGDASGNLAGAISAAATLAGSSGASADIVGAWEMAASLAGTGSTVAAIEAVAAITATVIGSSTLAGSVPGSPGFMSATITSAGDELSPSSLAAAVWNALVSEFQTSGSFGEAIGQGSAGLTQQQIRDALKLAPSSGDPADGSVDEVMLALYRVMGLDPTRPLVVTATERTAGAEIEQTIVEAPAGTVTVTRQ